MFDDMISTAGSICGAAELVKKKGAREIHVASTHGVFAGKAVERLRAAPIDSVVVTDTVPIGADKLLPKMKILSVAPMMGMAIKRIHQHESISEIFPGGDEQ
jgi:ribose-phosphate pyrophosphokinase